MRRREGRYRTAPYRSTPPLAPAAILPVSRPDSPGGWPSRPSWKAGFQPAFFILIPTENDLAHFGSCMGWNLRAKGQIPYQPMAAP